MSGLVSGLVSAAGGSVVLPLPVDTLSPLVDTDGLASTWSAAFLATLSLSTVGAASCSVPVLGCSESLALSPILLSSACGVGAVGTSLFAWLVSPVWACGSKLMPFASITRHVKAALVSSWPYSIPASISFSSNCSAVCCL